MPCGSMTGQATSANCVILIERLLIMVPRPLIDGADVETLPPGSKHLEQANHSLPAEGFFSSLREARNAFERELIANKLTRITIGMSRKTADDLKIERSHLHRKIKLLNVELRSEN